MASAFRLFYHNGYAMLKINPEQARTQAIYAEDVAGRMKILGIPRVPMNRIQQILDEASGKAERLVSWPEGISLSGGVEIHVADDKMEAEMILHPPRIGGDDLTLEDVRHALDIEGISSGINEQSIKKALQKKVYSTKVVIAEGRQPENGKGKDIKFNFLTDRGKPYLKMPFGRINLKELNFVQNAAAGAVLAEYLPAVPAVNGKNIFGNIINAQPPADAQLPGAGKNTKLDGDQIIALEKGNAVLNNNLVEIEPLLTVDNVNYETGNLKFDGTVQVRKEIADGFTVEASGDIILNQCAGRVTLKAGRDIILTGGINGGGQGICVSGGDVIARYIESATIQAEGSVIVQELVMHSDISSNENVLLKGKRAELIGGTLIAAGSLWCKKSGAANGTPTRIILGIYPRAMEDFMKFQQKIIMLEENCDDKRKKLKVLASRAGSSGGDHDRIHQAVVQIRQELDDEENQVSELTVLKNRLARYFSKNPDVIAVAEDIINPGSFFRLGQHEYRVTQKPAFKTYLCCENETIIQKGYNSHSAPELPEVPVFNELPEKLNEDYEK